LLFNVSIIRFPAFLQRFRPGRVEFAPPWNNPCDSRRIVFGRSISEPPGQRAGKAIVSPGAASVTLAQADFNRWVSDHGPALYRMAYRMVGDRHEAEDLLQEAFRSAWKSRGLFQADRGERAWLAAILRRRVVDHWRHRGAQRHTPIANVAEPGAPGEDPLANDYSDEMQGALNAIAPELRETLLLVVVGELTHQEAANLLDVPLGTVLSRVSRARAKLRDLLLARAAR
jgi:RNA polymerase sigma-70 factor (ECF subfamily)